MTIRTLIVDDEPLARARIRILLAAEPDVEVVGECATGLEAIEAIEEQQPDLVFLDVQMPQVDGFAVVEAIGSARMPMTIFVTAYDQFAIRAFDAQALDYLLKPYLEERFRTALERARRTFGARSAQQAVRQEIAALVSSLARRERPERLIVRSGPRIGFVEVSEIDWVQSEGNYLRLHTGKTSHLVRETLAGLEIQLDPKQFVRIHRSTIVNVRAVKQLESLFQGEYAIVLHDGTKLTSSKTYRGRLEDALGLSR